MRALGLTTAINYNLTLPCCRIIMLLMCLLHRHHDTAYMRLSIHVRISVCIYVCMYACMHLCVYTCMYSCMYVCIQDTSASTIIVYTRTDRNWTPQNGRSWPISSYY